MILVFTLWNFLASFRHPWINRLETWNADFRVLYWYITKISALSWHWNCVGYSVFNFIFWWKHVYYSIPCKVIENDNFSRFFSHKFLLLASELRNMIFVKFSFNLFLSKLTSAKNSGSLSGRVFRRNISQYS